MAVTSKAADDSAADEPRRAGDEEAAHQI